MEENSDLFVSSILSVDGYIVCIEVLRKIDRLLIIVLNFGNFGCKDF